MNLGDRETVARHYGNNSHNFIVSREEEKSQNPLHMKTKILSLILIPLLACLSTSPTSQAVTPPPDGGYPGGNTAEGKNALLSLTDGTYNTAVGWFSLQSNLTGNLNTAIGAGTPGSNTTGSENVALGGGAGSNVTTGSNVICIGNPGGNVNNSCFIGNIRGVATHNAEAIPVVIDSAGQLAR